MTQFVMSIKNQPLSLIISILLLSIPSISLNYTNTTNTTAPSPIPTQSPSLPPTDYCERAQAKYDKNIKFDKSISSTILLYGGESIISSNCYYEFELKLSGNLVLYSYPNDSIIWETNITAGTNTTNAMFEYNTDTVRVTTLESSDELWSDELNDVNEKIDRSDSNRIKLQTWDDGRIILSVGVYIIWQRPAVNATAMTTDTPSLNNSLWVTEIKEDFGVNSINIARIITIIIFIVLILIAVLIYFYGKYYAKQQIKKRIRLAKPIWQKKLAEQIELNELEESSSEDMDDFMNTITNNDDDKIETNEEKKEENEEINSNDDGMEFGKLVNDDDDDKKEEKDDDKKEENGDDDIEHGNVDIDIKESEGSLGIDETEPEKKITLQ